MNLRATVQCTRCQHKKIYPGTGYDPSCGSSCESLVLPRRTMQQVIGSNYGCIGVPADHPCYRESCQKINNTYFLDVPGGVLWVEDSLPCGGSDPIWGTNRRTSDGLWWIGFTVPSGHEFILWEKTQYLLQQLASIWFGQMLSDILEGDSNDHR